MKPEWWRFLAGVLVGEVRAEADGVPPLDMGKNSDTGPSYMPLGTAFRMASFRRNPNTVLQLIQDRERQRKATPWMCLSSRGLVVGTVCSRKLYISCRVENWFQIWLTNCYGIISILYNVSKIFLFICCIKTNSGQKCWAMKQQTVTQLKIIWTKTVQTFKYISKIFQAKQFALNGYLTQTLF